MQRSKNIQKSAPSPQDTLARGEGERGQRPAEERENRQDQKREEAPQIGRGQRREMEEGGGRREGVAADAGCIPGGGPSGSGFAERRAEAELELNWNC